MLYEYLHDIKNQNTVLLLRPTRYGNSMPILWLISALRFNYISVQVGTAVALLLVCELLKGRYMSCPPQEYRVYPLRHQDSGPPTRSYYTASAGVVVRCCCCWGLGARTHTKPAPDLWVEGINTTPGDTHSRLRRPGHLPSHSDRAHDFRVSSPWSQSRHN